MMPSYFYNISNNYLVIELFQNFFLIAIRIASTIMAFKDKNNTINVPDLLFYYGNI